jgi:hypothetical protein
MERLRRRSQEETARPLPPAASTTPAADTLLAPTSVQVVWGPMVEQMTVGGMTAGEVRALLQRPYNIPPQATALVNGQPVAPEYRLAPGDTLEFARPAGEKGGCG